MDEATAARRPAGQLEASVLAVLWSAGEPLSAADVQEALDTGLARTTVATIMVRLHEKGVLRRERDGRGYRYAPVHDPAGLAARRMRTELDRESDRESVLSHFVAGLSDGDEDVLRALLTRQFPAS